MRVRSRSISYTYTVSKDKLKDKDKDRINKKIFRKKIIKKEVIKTSKATKKKDIIEVPAANTFLKGIENIPGFATSARKALNDTKNSKPIVKQKIIRAYIPYQNKQITLKSPKNNLFTTRKRENFNSWPLERYKSKENLPCSSVNVKLPNDDLYSVFGALESRCKMLEKTVENEQKCKKQALNELKRVNQLHSSTLIVKNNMVDELTIKLNKSREEHEQRLESTLTEVHKLQAQKDECFYENQNLRKQLIEADLKVREISNELENKMKESSLMPKKQETTLLVREYSSESKENELVKDLESEICMLKVEIKRLNFEKTSLEAQAKTSYEKHLKSETKLNESILKLEVTKAKEIFLEKKAKELTESCTDMAVKLGDMKSTINNFKESQKLNNELLIKREAALKKLKTLNSKLQQNNELQSKEIKDILKQFQEKENGLKLEKKQKLELERIYKVTTSKLKRMTFEKTKLSNLNAALEAKVKVKEEQLIVLRENLNIKQTELSEVSTKLLTFEQTTNEKEDNKQMSKLEKKEVANLLENNKLMTEKLLKLLPVE